MGVPNDEPTALEMTLVLCSDASSDAGGAELGGSGVNPDSGADGGGEAGSLMTLVACSPYPGAEGVGGSGVGSCLGSLGGVGSLTTVVGRSLYGVSVPPKPGDSGWTGATGSAAAGGGWAGASGSGGAKGAAASKGAASSAGAGGGAGARCTVHSDPSQYRS